MREQWLTGGVVAVVAALAVWWGESWGLVHVSVLGVGLGAVLAVVPGRGEVSRLAGFAIGLVVAWIGYALRAAVLPDTDSGRAVATFLVLGALTVVAALTFGRVQLWTLLLGATALAGAYELAFAADTPAFASESVSAVTSVVLTAVIGFVGASLAASFVTVSTTEDAAAEARHREVEV